MNWNEIKYFSKWEWKKDPDKATPELVQAMDQIRELVGVPAIIHVCWDDGGHSERSFHYTGQAVDFHFADQGQSYWRELLAIMSVPRIGGIGFYPFWSPRPGWHIDIRSDKLRTFWMRLDGEYQYGVEKIVAAIQLAEKG